MDLKSGKLGVGAVQGCSLHTALGLHKEWLFGGAIMH